MFKKLFLALIGLNLLFVQLSSARCLIADKPLEMLECITLNPQMIVNLLSTGDLKNFCSTANSYLSCMKTYITDCVGGKVGMGAIDELNDLTKKCCIYPDKTECIATSMRNKLTKLLQKITIFLLFRSRAYEKLFCSRQ